MSMYCTRFSSAPFVFFLLVTLIAGNVAPFVTPPTYAAHARRAPAVLLPAADELPLSFVPNVGQTDSAVQFQARAGGSTLFFTPDEVVLAFAPPAPTDTDDSIPSLLPPLLPPAPTHDATTAPVVRLQFDGANEHDTTTLYGAGQLPGTVNYFIGDDPSQWHRNIQTYGGVLYHNLYTGIDLHYTGRAGNLKGTYSVAPGANPARIRWHYAGATDVARDDTSGALHITLANGQTMTEDAPIAWQTIDGQRIPVVASYTTAPDGTFGFALGAYDPTHPLIIDPTMQWSTYLGGSSDDYGEDVAIDDVGYIYVTGRTYSSDFPTQGAYQATYKGNIDAFVTKFSPDGQTMVFSTYLGGSGANGDKGLGIAVDHVGAVYLTGQADYNFPLVNAVQAYYGGGYMDMFIAKLNAAGNDLIYSTFYGGADADTGNDIAIDSVGNVYVDVTTQSATFPLVNALQSTHGGGDYDAAVVKLNATGDTVIYSTFLGGSGSDGGIGIACDSTGTAYIVGQTRSSNFPLSNAYQSTYSGNQDAFLAKLSADGQTLHFSTYIGGTGGDAGYDIVLDTANDMYIAGYTSSTTFPVQNAFDSTHNGGYDAFITKFSNDSSTLLSSTFLGGTANDYGYDIVSDNTNNVYLTGKTNSTDFPTNSPLQASNGGGYDAFVAKLNPTGTALLFSTYLGGTADDETQAIAVDQWGRAVVNGFTKSSNFPTKNPKQASLNGTSDAFVSRMSTMLGSGVFVDSGQALGSDFSQAVAMGDVDGDGDTDAILVNSSGQYNRVYTNNGNGLFTDSGQTLGSSESQDVALGDIDHDGDLDMVVANWNEANTVWTNNGSGTFTDSGQNLGSGYTYGVALGDVDNDGDLDVVFADSAATYIWLNNGSGTFTQSGNSIGSVDGSDLALGDIDGDGDLDAFLANYNAFNEVWLNDGTGKFISNGQTLGSSSGYSMMVALGDVDNDGDLDAFVANSGSQANEVWLNNGAGTFVSNGQTLVGNNSQDIALGDIDGDSDLDAVVGNNGWDEVWLNDGTGLFTDSGQNLESHNSDGIALSDVDNDGDLDIFAAVFGTTGSTVWRNQNTPLELVSTSPTTNSLNVARDADIVATFNRTVDATTVTSATFTIRGEYTGVYTRNYTIAGSRVTFDALPQYKVGEEIEVTLSKGLRGQGDTTDFTPYTWQFHTAVEGGTGVFADSGQRLGSSKSQNVKLGDVDNDGDLDAFVSNFGQPNKLWLNDGNGNFTDSGQSMGTTEQSRGHALADIDNDGDLDAYVPSWGYDKVWVNDGTGMFTESPQNLGDENSREVKFGDLDGDGDVDIFEANWGTDKIRLNDGTGDFTTVKQDIWGEKVLVLRWVILITMATWMLLLEMRLTMLNWYL